jgi:hypothetical protein
MTGSTVAETEPRLLELQRDFGGIGCVDHSRQAGIGVVEQEPVVVAQSGKLRDLKFAHPGLKVVCGRPPMVQASRTMRGST